MYTTDCVHDEPERLRPAEPLKGRGSLENPTGRFESIVVEADPDAPPLAAVHTQYFKDDTKTIVSFNDSPDVGFDASINPYRGCEHGCIYCYARPTHEYLGLSAGLDFETKIFVKTDAAALLRKKLLSKSWQPQTIAVSGVTDPYQPVEKQLKVTRGCLAVLAEFRNPVGIITKNHLVTRDIDMLGELARFQAACVLVSVTSLSAELAGVMEPRASTPARRLEAIRQLHEAGIPVGVMMGPIVPGLTDHEVPAVLQAAAEAGAQTAHYTMLRLPHGNKDLFETWLTAHFPDRKNRVLNRIRDVRNGELDSPVFGSRMRGTGTYADHVAQLFGRMKKRYGLHRGLPPLSTHHFRRDPATQLSLFKAFSAVED